MKTKLILMIFFSALLVGCEKDDVINDSINTLEAKVESLNGQVLVGQQVTLNGTLSKDNAGKPFQYLWRFKNKPTTSVIELEGKTTAKPKFTPDKDGVYIVELKIYNQSFFKTDDISITVNHNSPQGNETIIIDTDITAARHLTNIFEDSSIPDYLITKDIHVTGALIIDAGVTIAFEAHTAMYIDNPGSIETLPAANTFTVFTGKTKSLGFWKGLVINSNSPINKLERVIIEYAGDNMASGMHAEAALSLDKAGAANLKLVSSIFQYNKGFAIAAETGTKLTTETFNIFKNNQKLVRLPASQLIAINGLSDFLNNDLNTIELIGDRINASQDITWSPIQNSIKYALKGKLEIASGLIMTEGLEFQMEQDAEIAVTPTGYLRTIGTPQYPIKFHGSQSTTNGHWKGISIKSNHSKNELKYVEVFDAGSNIMDGFAIKTAIGVDGESNASIKITDTKIAKSGGNGLLVENMGHLNSFGFTRFTNNTGSAVCLPANEVSRLNDASTFEFTGNGHNGVEIFTSILFNQGESVWPALHFGASYLVSGNLSIQSGLKIEPGAIFKFAEDKMMGVFTNGYLYAKGNANQKIIFTGINQTKGFWNGIIFRSNNDKNIMDYTEVNYAGKTLLVGINKISSIGLDGDYLSKLSITNSKISHGFGYGVAVEDSRATINNDVEIANNFMDLNMGSVFK